MRIANRLLHDSQALALLLSDNMDSPTYGYIALGIIWLPGVAAAIHVISMYRNDHSCAKVLTWALLLAVLYPAVPLLAYVALLWNRPKELR